MNVAIIISLILDGSEGRFVFNITDGLHTTKDYLFEIKTKPVTIKLLSKPLHIFPLQKKYLTSNHLLALMSDVNRTIYYDVINPPSLGRLMMESEKPGIFRIVSTFTQSDLNNSKVFYEHTHQFSDLYANDSFLFTVRAHLAPKLVRQVIEYISRLYVFILIFIYSMSKKKITRLHFGDFKVRW